MESEDKSGENDEIVEEEDVTDDQDPVAEGESLPEANIIEPSFRKANSLRFAEICKRLESLWRLRRNPKLSSQVKEVGRLKALLPPGLMKHLTTPENPPESLFPLLRLLMPEKDSSRTFLMKESALLKAYKGAFSLGDNSKDFQKLLHFKDATIVDDIHAVGDFSCVLMKVLNGRVSSEDSDFTVGDINRLLDDLANIRFEHKKAKEQFERAKSSGSPSKRSKPPTMAEFWADFVLKLNPPNRRGLSPLEHKWLVRIIRQEMQFGLGWKSVLKWYNRHAIALYDAHTSLKAICKLLCDPHFSVAGLANQQEEAAETNRLASYMVPSMAAVTFGTPFTPMLSARTFTYRLLHDIAARHRAFAEEEKASNTSSPAADSLSFRFPTFSIETKLDGERMNVHISHEGVVKIHSRVGNWYSRNYSPVLGPALRRAFGKHKVDLIVDGEILAWDSGRNETIPFGSNRTVAKLRQTWMKKNGTLDPKDLGLHDNDKDIKEVRFGSIGGKDDDEDIGRECWLLFSAFDILYIGGPDAADILSQTVSPHVDPRPTPGSIIHLDGYERKKLLYKLLEEQEREVEIVPTYIVRSTGQMVEGDRYFSSETPTMECEQPAYRLDSQSWTMNQQKSKISRYDAERSREKSDEQISLARTSAVDHVYKELVEDRRMEGLLFKDLSAPYHLGEKSKSYKFWHKYKPDYETGDASDLDLVIVGCYFATGLRYAGKPSSFLVACVDSQDPERFFPVCKVNAGGMSRPVLEALYLSTGMVTNEESGKISWGEKWFSESDKTSIPDFVSTRPVSEGSDGIWRPLKKDIPDMWISPVHSRILTLNAGEIVASDAFPPGITLRFPRVTALRDPSEKSAPEVENEDSLWELFQEKESRRSGGHSGGELAFYSPLVDPSRPRRFLTENEFIASKRKKKTPVQKKLFKVPGTVKDGQRMSNLLEGLVFCVLGGIYQLDPDIAEKTEVNGINEWVKDACLVRSSADVKRYIDQHGGTRRLTPTKDTLVIGGTESDDEVVNYIQAIENAATRLMQRKGKPTKQSVTDEEVAAREGVLHWSFVYMLVQRRSISPEAKHGTLQTSVLDFLARPSKKEAGKKDHLEEVACEDLSNPFDMQRALGLVSKIRRPAQSLESWQDCAKQLLAPEERWVVKTKFQTLWNYEAESSIHMIAEVVLFPDIHDIPGLPTAEIFRRDMLASTLPLCRLMGAAVSNDFNPNVTHVLCDLGTEDEVPFTADLDRSLFVSPQRGDRLLKFLDRQEMAEQVLLVSPAWVRNRKWCGNK